MPNFTDNKVDQAYEKFMKQSPGFQRDSPEAKVIQHDLKKARWSELLRNRGKKNNIEIGGM